MKKDLRLPREETMESDNSSNDVFQSFVSSPLINHCYGLRDLPVYKKGVTYDSGDVLLISLGVIIYESTGFCDRTEKGSLT
jgi:hypothetical protein